MYNKKLEERLESQKGKEWLFLEERDIKDETIKVISEFIQTNKITKLNLHDSWISGEDDWDLLAQFLKDNKTITLLKLRGNNIDDKGAKALAKLLEHNNTLTSVDLLGNNIDDEGAKVLAELLKVNKNIISLSLRGNNLTDEGAKALGEAMKINKTLTSLDLRDNNQYTYDGNVESAISDKNVKAIEGSLEKNKALVKFVAEFLATKYMGDSNNKRSEKTEKKDFSQKELNLHKLSQVVDQELLKTCLTKTAIFKEVKGSESEEEKLKKIKDKIEEDVKNSFFSLTGVHGSTKSKIYPKLKKEMNKEEKRKAEKDAEIYQEFFDMKDVIGNTIEFLGPRSLWEISISKSGDGLTLSGDIVLDFID